jgi:cytochrome c oxidase subunit 2
MSVMDQSEKKVLMITGATLALFIFSILYARGKYNDIPECLPYDKAYEEPKVVKLDEKTYQVYGIASNVAVPAI